jgi:hypothetical protein
VLIETSDIILTTALGIGLSAACGFRIFVPFLVASAASLFGFLPLAEGFEWIGTLPALFAFAVATGIEVLAFYIPWLDNALDAIATPVAVVAGMIAAASVMTDLPPLIKWTVALIGGGGVAGLMQGATAFLRLKSTAMTGGFGNAMVATGELFGAVLTSVLALVMPIVMIFVILGVCFAVYRMAGHMLFGRKKSV